MRRTVKLLILTLITASCSLVVSSAFAAQDEFRRELIEFIAFSEDSSEYLVKVTDENIGTVLQVRTTKKNKLVKAYPFNADEEKSKVAFVRRKHSLTQDPHEDPENPKKKGLILMTAQRGDKLNIYLMKDEAIKKFDDIELIKDKDGNVATASVKQTIWNQKGKYFVLVIHQKLPGKFAFEGDFVHAEKFKSYKVKFD